MTTEDTNVASPERIWARPHQGVLDSGDWNAADGVIDGEEYIRADLVLALVTAGNTMANALRGDYIVPGSAKAWDAALAAFQEPTNDRD